MCICIHDLYPQSKYFDTWINVFTHVFTDCMHTNIRTHSLLWVHLYIRIPIYIYTGVCIQYIKQLYLSIYCSLSLSLALSLSVSCSFSVFQRCATNIYSARFCVCTLIAEALQLWNIRLYKSWIIYKNLNICHSWFHLIGPGKVDVICLGPNLKPAVTYI